VVYSIDLLSLDALIVLSLRRTDIGQSRGGWREDLHNKANSAGV
jgi:hypothetical protein